MTNLLKIKATPLSKFNTSASNQNVLVKPETKIVFEIDYNILDYHKGITSYFEYLKSDAYILLVKGRINNLRQKLKKTNLVNRKKELLDKIDQELNSLNNEEKFQSYLANVSPLLEQYSKLGSYRGGKNHTYTQKIEQLQYQLNRSGLNEEQKNHLKNKIKYYIALSLTPDAEHRIRENLITSYFNQVKKIYPVEIEHKVTRYPECSTCGAVILPNSVNEEGFQICSVCTQVKYKPGIKYEVSKENEKTSEKSDDVNILKAFDRRACLYPVTLPEKMFDDLDDYFNELGIEREKVRRSPLEGRFRGGTNHEMLWKALEVKGYNSYYKHADYIGLKYWDWARPNIDHLKDDFLNMYYKTQAAFNSIPNKSRKSSISTQLRLFHQLELLGDNCSAAEFKIPIGTSGLKEQEILWEKMCKLANDPQIFYIPLK